MLETADKRMLYYKAGLAHDPSLADIRRYLDQHHGDVLPEGLFAEEDVSA